jgi:hypothetical protein
MARLVAGADPQLGGQLGTIETLHITSSKTDDCLTWNVPTDLELKRIKLEQLLDPELGQR